MSRFKMPAQAQAQAQAQALENSHIRAKGKRRGTCGECGVQLCGLLWRVGGAGDGAAVVLLGPHKNAICQM